MSTKPSKSTAAPTRTDSSSALTRLANFLEVPVDSLRANALDLHYTKIGFRPGDLVNYGGGEAVYEVADIKHFPHGWMVGIYDEPPGNHVDWINPVSLVRIIVTTPDTPPES